VILYYQSFRFSENNLILKVYDILTLGFFFLEIGGDALIRIGLAGPYYSMAAGAATLFAYGVLVNKSGVDFNRF